MPRGPRAAVAVAGVLLLLAVTLVVTLVALHVYADYQVQRHTCEHFGGAWRGFPASECDWAGEQRG